MAHYYEKGPDGKQRIVHVDSHGDKLRRNLVRRESNKDSKDKKK